MSQIPVVSREVAVNQLVLKPIQHDGNVQCLSQTISWNSQMGSEWNRNHLLSESSVSDLTMEGQFPRLIIDQTAYGLNGWELR